MSSSATGAGPIESNGSKKRAFPGQQTWKSNKKFTKREKTQTEGTTEEVLVKDIRALLEKQKSDVDDAPQSSANAADRGLPEPFTEVEVTVLEISSTGDGLALGQDRNHVYVVPFTAPGDTVTAKVIRHFTDDSYSLTDFVKVLKPSSVRNDTLVQCPYFETCSGCQFQMLPYEWQLSHKRNIVHKAYRNFSGLAPELVPPVGETIGSPLQYGYRTKLTPHFDGPPGHRSDGRNGIKRRFDNVPPIGFMRKGTRHTIDIEDCPIGTGAVRLGMARERKRVAAELDKYHRGATLLLREHTERTTKGPNRNGADCKEMTADPDLRSVEADAVYEDRGPYLHKKSCVTDNKAKTTEYIGDYVFVNPAGAFFQNNNSILPIFTSYIRDHILPRESPPDAPPISYLIDAYSGSGLFTITLSSLFKRSMGIDIAASSIESANHNAKLNNLTPERASFIAADAANLFASVQEFPANETVVVIDPPRKGCDMNFLRQLIEYAPARICYVSCNVHTRARDIGVLVSGVQGTELGYEIESVRGFDFFPQTGHVEGVAVLTRKDRAV